MSKIDTLAFIGSHPFVVRNIQPDNTKRDHFEVEQTLLSIQIGQVQAEGQIIQYTRQRDSLRVVLEWFEENKGLEVKELAGKVKDLLGKNKEKVETLKAELAALPKNQQQGSEVQAKLENQVALRNAWHKLVSTLGSSSVQEATEYLNKEIQYAEMALESHLTNLNNLNNLTIKMKVTEEFAKYRQTP